MRGCTHSPNSIGHHRSCLILTISERPSTDRPQAGHISRLELLGIGGVSGTVHTDAHAKNFGILHPTAHTAALSPMYDAVPAQIINPMIQEMGLRIAGRIRIDRITGATLVEKARRWSIGARTCAEAVEDALHRLNEGGESATDRFPNTDPAIPEFLKARTGYLLETLHETD